MFHSFQSSNRAFFFAFVVCVGAFATWATAETPVAAQGLPQVEPPPLVRLTGVLVPIEKSSLTNEPSTLTVRIGESKYLLKIRKFEKLSGQSMTDLRLLERLFPPFLRMTGPEPLLLSLQDLSAAGKPVAVEGRLYSDDRLLLLTDVQEETPPDRH
jgi:hypothetical protein